MAATPSLDTVNPQGDSAGAPCINRRPKVPPVLALASTREIASPYPFWIQRKPRRLITAPASTDPEYGQFATYITPTRNFVDMPPPFLPSKLRRKVVTFLVSETPMHSKPTPPPLSTNSPTVLKAAPRPRQRSTSSVAPTRFSARLRTKLTAPNCDDLRAQESSGPAPRGQLKQRAFDRNPPSRKRKRSN